MSDEALEKICFVISSIGKKGSEARKHSDQVFEYLITPIVDECGYKAIRADMISEPGIITSQVIQYLLECPLVIADLTDQNPNVFYELAVRHAARLPVIQMITNEQTIPFDVAHSRTIQYDIHDIASVHNCQQELKRQIMAAGQDTFDIESPISAAMVQISLKRSDNPLERSNAEIIERLSTLEDMVRDILDMNFQTDYEMADDNSPRETGDLPF